MSFVPLKSSGSNYLNLNLRLIFNLKSPSP
uniref:Uncharacterized protein n=1 Tax=Lepeophtheirus salmonis TaxID=72036 RepID=A0A0K2T043_LEPSM